MNVDRRLADGVVLKEETVNKVRFMLQLQVGKIRFAYQKLNASS